MTEPQYARLTPVNTWITQGSLIEAGGETMIVHKVNPKKYVCYDENGTCWNVDKRGQVALPADTPFNSAPYLAKLKEAEEAERKRREEAYASTLTLGSVVEFAEAAEKKKHPGKYAVILGPNHQGQVRVAKLGGDGGRYFYGPHTMFVEVPA